jgi:hypothetical protein
VGLDALAAWCTRWLGAPPAAELFEAGHLSTVKGLRLADGREVVVKVRPREPRLTGCAAVRDRLRGGPGHPVIGHGDWHPENLRWHGPQLIAVHDWDSVICQPEPAIAGLAAASFAGIDGPPAMASVENSAAFLDAYQQARGRRWTSQDYAACWAAGLWLRAFDAKTRSLDGDPEQILTRHEARVRLRLAGLNPDLAAEAPGQRPEG